MSENPYEDGLDKNAANFVPLSPLSFIRPHEGCLSGPSGGHLRFTPVQLEAGLRTHRPPWQRACQSRPWRRRHRIRHRGQHAGTLRDAFRRSDERSGSQHDQHAPRSEHHRLYSRARRRQGPDHGHAIFSRGQRRSRKARQAGPSGHRHRRRTGRAAARRGRAPWRPEL